MRGNPALLEKGKSSTEAVLRFLLDHTFSTKEILQDLIGFSDNGIWRLLKKMQSQGLIMCQEYPTAFHGKTKIYGITLQGVHYATPETEVPNDNKRFEPSKFRVANFQHYLDIQTLNLWAAKNGYTFISAKDFYSDAAATGDKRADAVLRAAGEVIAVEIERNVKTRLRYTEILLNYFRELKQGRFTKVWYLMPDEKIRSSIERVIKSIKELKVKGALSSRTVVLGPQHWAFFEFKIHPFYAGKDNKAG